MSSSNGALDSGGTFGGGRKGSELQSEIVRLRKQMHDMETPKQSGGMKLVKAVTKGFGNIAQSLNTPASKQRPRIARIMENKPDIVNVPHKMNANYLKHPALRGQTIQGNIGRTSNHPTPKDVYANRTRTNPYKR